MKRLLSILLVLLFSLSSIAALDSSELTKVKEAGSYPVEVFSETETGEQISKTIIVLVTFPNTVVNREVNEAIDGSSFRVNENTITNLSPEQLIKKGNVRAWDLTTGDSVAIKDIEITTLSKGHFEITYATAKGTKLVVSAYEGPESALDLAQNYIRPNNFKFSNLTTVSVLIIGLFALPAILILILIGRTNKQLRHAEKILYSRE